MFCNPKLGSKLFCECCLHTKIVNLDIKTHSLKEIVSISHVKL